MHTIKLFINKQVFDAWNDALKIHAEQLQKYVDEYSITTVEQTESTYQIEIKYRSPHVLLMLGRSLRKIEAIHKITY